MADLNQIPDLQATLRDNMLVPTNWASPTALQAKHSSFLKGGELASVTVGIWPRTFVWVPSSLWTADNVTVIKPTDVATTSPGRWHWVGTPFLTTSGVYDPGNLVDGAGVTTTLACTGADVGDYVVASFSDNLQGIILYAWVSSVSTVSFRFQNETGGAIDLASGTLRALVMKK